MHIKQITLSNFRSFRQQPEIHPFSAGTNVVVGRNGSGKSNLFDAVQFVLLSPKFYSLRTEERQALLHEGSGSAAVNAFVELVFDNSDNRFSLETSDEVVLRRTIGHKKDEYFLNRKRTTKNEVMSLLEGAGFSKSNPYFIVQQGKVNALCVMSDTERLQLLKEVAGTTVYDEKKRESLNKMEENHTNIEKINDHLQYMEERLDELKKEKEELTQYQKLDKGRRAMEYTLYDKELRKARETLDEIEHARADEISGRGDIYKKGKEIDGAINNVEVIRKKKTYARKRNEIYIAGLEEDKTAAVTHHTKLELNIKEFEEAVKQGQETSVTNKKELAQLEVEISTAQKDLNSEVKPKYTNAKELLNVTTLERNQVQKKIEGLYAKQGRGRQYETKQERDVYLTSQIEELRAVQSDKKSRFTEKNNSLSNLRKTIIATTQDLEKKIVDMKNKNVTMRSLEKVLAEKKKQRNEMAETRKLQWRDLDDLTDKMSEARDNKNKSLSALRKSMPRATAQGLDALTRIVAEEKFVPGEQYFGLLMQNFELIDVKFRTAVEVAAQNSLFHVIVDTDETAAKLMHRLEKDRLGRVTFLPLNQLRVQNLNYPNSSDVTPLLSRCLQYDKKVDRAMKHVFGRKLLARNVDVASTWSSQCAMDAITLEGDLCSSKGALTGGFVDSSKSRLFAHLEVTKSEETMKKFETEHHEMKQKNDACDQYVSNLMGEMQRMEAKKANLDSILKRCEDDISSKKTRINKSTLQVEKTENDDLPPIQVDINGLQNQIECLEAETGTELSDTLNKIEKSLLNELKETQTKLGTEFEVQTQALEEISVKHQRLRSLLDDNLLKRKQELEKEIAGSSSRHGQRPGDALSTLLMAQEDLKLCLRELEESNLLVKEVENKFSGAKEISNNLQSELILSKNELDKLIASDAENKKELLKAQETEEKLMNKRSMCVSKRELYIRKIQELGSLPPSSELDAFAKSSIAALMKKLESFNKKLKKYSHVNKKAYDQYVNFSEQRESLLNRKEELDRGADKVKELVSNLDCQKDEAINRTFRGVSAHFKQVFKELVPNGSGELIMRMAHDEGEGTSDESGKDENEMIDQNNPNVSLYRGIGVKVQFSPVGENYLMSQLSGGQKALVALGLIFAIQRCDPAPFYLFDELDQALDSTYRAAVAGLIQRQANNQENPTQFICSTFRPELVSVANNSYGISHQNKVSSVHEMSKRDALHFIANLMNEEEAVGEVTSLATSAKVSRSSNASAKARKRKMIESSSTSGHEEKEILVSEE